MSVLHNSSLVLGLRSQVRKPAVQGWSAPPLAHGRCRGEDANLHVTCVPTRLHGRHAQEPQRSIQKSWPCSCILGSYFFLQHLILPTNVRVKNCNKKYDILIVILSMHIRSARSSLALSGIVPDSCVLAQSPVPFTCHTASAYPLIQTHWHTQLTQKS